MPDQDQTPVNTNAPTNTAGQKRAGGAAPAGQGTPPSTQRPGAPLPGSDKPVRSEDPQADKPGDGPLKSPHAANHADADLSSFPEGKKPWDR